MPLGNLGALQFMSGSGYTAQDRITIENAWTAVQAEIEATNRNLPFAGGLRARGLPNDVESVADPDTSTIADYATAGVPSGVQAHWKQTALAYQLLHLSNLASNAPSNVTDKAGAAAEAIAVAAKGGIEATKQVLSTEAADSHVGLSHAVLPFQISRIQNGVNVGSYNPTIAEYDAYADPTGAHPDLHWNNLDKSAQSALLGPFAEEWFGGKTVVTATASGIKVSEPFAKVTKDAPVDAAQPVVASKENAAKALNPLTDAGDSNSKFQNADTEAKPTTSAGAGGMETKHKVMIGVAVVAVAAIGYYLYSKSKAGAK